MVLILRSSLGTTPISSFNYVLRLNFPLTFGTTTFLFNVALIAFEFWLLRGIRTRRDTVEVLLQLPFSLLLGIFIDANMALTESVRPTGYAASLAVLALGCTVQAVGIVLEIKPQVVKMSAEGFVVYAARRYNRDFGRTKVLFDVVLVLLAVAASLALSRKIEGVREGTVIAACVTGFIVSFLSRYVFTRANFERVFPFRY
ncbi:MAG: hypothetical protein K2I43_01115, partial [Alistipes sp.]|nr:hypothetical protein [Alistipes sp.]